MFMFLSMKRVSAHFKSPTHDQRRRRNTLDFVVERADGDGLTADTEALDLVVDVLLSVDEGTRASQAGGGLYRMP